MPDLNLDLSVLDDVSPPFVQDTSVSVTVGYSNNAVPVDDFIMAWQQTNPSTPTQEQLNSTVKTLKTCLDANFGFITQCPRDEYRLNQVLKMINLIEDDAVSGFGTPELREKTQSEIIRDNLQRRAETPVSQEELDNIFLENGKTGLGTLLIPFLYIRWGTTVLHNSFPSRNLDDNPGQVRNNVRGLRITYDTQTSGGESTGGSGSMMPGTSTCELTLNPQLVDGDGRSITVNTDGAELLVMWGYPNASLVRVHTFAQTSIRDSFYNEQTTTVGFRGISWKTTRLSSQKRFNGGDWRKVVTDIAFEACATVGFEEKNCKVRFDPDDFGTGDSAFRIGETVQTGRGDIFAHLANVVEKSAACTVTKTNDREGKDDRNRGQYVISISCNPELRQEDASDPKLVDRALWLGQVLAEKIELSDGGDNSASHGNTGGKCGRNRPFRARVKNAILKNFTDGCDYRLLKPNDIVSTNANTANEYILELVKKETETEDSDYIRDVALLAPFDGKVKIDRSDCKSSDESVDASCGPTKERGGTGNSLTITAEDPRNPLLEGISWTFYHLAGIQVTDGAQVTAGTQIATQGMSGTPEVQSTGIRIVKENATLTVSESTPFINDYIRTLTYPCRLAEASCLLPGFATSEDVGTGDDFHVHLEAFDFQNLIPAFDNMAATDIETCYNLNQAGNVGASGSKKCWDASWERSFKEEVLTACVRAHKKRNNRSPCDFYIFAKDGGSRGDRQSRVIANPYPQLNHIYSTDPSFAVGVRFFEEGTDTPGFYSNGAGEELVAQLFHGDVSNLNQTGLANTTIFGCDDDDTPPAEDLGDTSGNTFLEENTTEVPETNANTEACGSNGRYSGDATDRNFKVLIKFCEVEGCNPKDIAAFINAECNWNINDVNHIGCSGMFQCCPGDISGKPGSGAPEKQMVNFLKTYQQPAWWPADAIASDFSTVSTFFTQCSSLQNATFEQQLAAWLAYKSAYTGSTAVDVSEGLCLNYTQIALPALIPVVRTNFNSLLQPACEQVASRASCQSYHKSNQPTWFDNKSYGTSEVKGICQYAIRSARNDPRLTGNCTFGNPLLVGNGLNSANCSNNSNNRSLNARNTGTLSSGGLRDIKFRQEIKLNAQFGVCPRNVFLAPTSSDGLPQYILLPNMDNTDGFADFKIRSVSLDWNGSWRWSVTAFRPAGQVTFELPTTLAQPRSLDEWTDYYWFPNFQEDGNQFAPPGQRQSYNADGNALNVASIGNELRNGVEEEIKALFDTIQTIIREKPTVSSLTDIRDDDAIDLNNRAAQIKSNCRGQSPGCLTRIELHRDTSGLSDLTLKIAPPNADGSTASLDFTDWLDFTMLTDIRTVAGNVSQE